MHARYPLLRHVICAPLSWSCGVALRLIVVTLLMACGPQFRSAAEASCPCVARYDVLMELYNNTNGAGWTNSSGWGEYNACTWFGVTCSGSDVTAVALPSNNLRGPLPASWSNLTALHG